MTVIIKFPWLYTNDFMYGISFDFITILWEKYTGISISSLLMDSERLDELLNSLQWLELWCTNMLKLPNHLYHGLLQQLYNGSLRLLINCRVPFQTTYLMNLDSLFSSPIQHQWFPILFQASRTVLCME